MRTTRVIGLTAALLGALATAGCSSGSASKAGTSQSATATQSASSTISARPTTSSASATPTSSGTAAGAPGVPEPARQHTKAGAKAFAGHYISLINSAGQKPKVGVLEPLALASCKSCDNYEGTVRYFVQHGERFDGPQYKIKKTDVLGHSEVGTFVRVIASEPAVNIVGVSGDNVKSYPAVDSSISVFELSWKRGWHVVTIKGE